MKTTFLITCIETGEKNVSSSLADARVWALRCRKVRELWGAKTTFKLTRITERDEPLDLNYICADCGEDYAEHRRGDFGGVECQRAS